MEPVAEVEVVYFRRKDGMYYAKLKCVNCKIKGLYPAVLSTVDVDFKGREEYFVKECMTPYCYTLWGCKRNVQQILKRTKRYLATMQTEELSRQLVGIYNE